MEVKYDDGGVVESAWTATASYGLSIAAMCSSKIAWDKGKIELCTCTCQPVVSDPKRTRKIV